MEKLSSGSGKGSTEEITGAGKSGLAEKTESGNEGERCLALKILFYC